MKLDAEFLCSALTMGDCPRWRRAEIALAGRSNVGKSSLLNALAGRKNLARISKTPGRTRCLNFFTVGERLALVDLPGYGYAKIAHSAARKIAFLAEQYLRHRRELITLVLLVDARRGPEQEEFALAQLLQNRSSRPGKRTHLIVVATKCDKLKRTEVLPALHRFEAFGAAPSLCSSLTGEGIDQVRREIIGVVLAHRPEPSNATGAARTQTAEASR
jgi:GTP-binding protein